MKIVIAILLAQLVSCSKNNKRDIESILTERCWQYIATKSSIYIDQGAGICFFSDHKCYDYVVRNNIKIPFSNSIADVNEYDLDEIFMNWSINNNLLTIGNRRYNIQYSDADSIVLLEFDSKGSIYLIKDSLSIKTYWGSMRQKVPEKYQ